MAPKRSVIVAGAASALLFAGSSAFAMASGILGGHPADAVGSFQPVQLRIEDPAAVAGPTSVLATTAPGAAPSTSVAPESDTTGVRATTGARSVADPVGAAPPAFPIAGIPKNDPVPTTTAPHHED